VDEQKKQKADQLLFNYAKYSTMAIQMIVVVCLGVFGGIKLDHWLKFGFPIFTLSLSVLSVFAAVYLSIKDIIKNKPEKE
jgi:hypothetical protein